MTFRFWFMAWPPRWRYRDRQREAEGRSGAVLAGLEPDLPSVVLDDLPAHREPDPGPRVDVPGVQALEDDEDPVGVLGVDADAVVGHGELPVLTVAARGDAHHGGSSPWNLIALEIRFWSTSPSSERSP